MSTKTWTARGAHITAAENGFIVQLTTFESAITLVCKDGAELLALLGSVDWRTDAPRGLPPTDTPAGAGGDQGAIERPRRPW